VNVDGMDSWRKVVQIQFESGAARVIPDQDRADGFTLSILEVDLSFGATGQRGRYKNCESNERDSEMFHAGIIEPGVPSRYGELRRHQRAILIHKRVEYTARKFHISQGRVQSWHWKRWSG